jgi:hypothetical protein
MSPMEDPVGFARELGSFWAGVGRA